MKKAVKALFVLLFIILTVSGALAAAPKPLPSSIAIVPPVAPAKETA